MAVDSYVFYDTAAFGVTAGATATLFQSAQGSAAGRTKNNTNWIGAGSLPSDNSFLIKGIGVSLNQAEVLADIGPLINGTYLEMFIYNKTRFLAPIRRLIERNAYSGVLQLAAAAAQTYFGLLGQPFMFDTPKQIDGGVSFKVEMTQNAALSVATNVLCLLYGEWTRPD